MAAATLTRPPDPVLYPDSDGQPMSDNTLQFSWIVTIKEGLEFQYADRADVFVAGDLLWYPVEGEPTIRCAPDVLVAFGRPKGYRGSYQQWREGGVAPAVVWEILSPSNSRAEMAGKRDFYERYGVEEFYSYDPETFEIGGWERRQGVLRAFPVVDGYVSPRLGVRFEMGTRGLRLYHPDGEPFRSLTEMGAVARQARALAVREREKAAREHARAERLAQRLRELGVEVEE
jgi:Uma2 family endonuclease